MRWVCTRVGVTAEHDEARHACRHGSVDAALTPGFPLGLS